MDKGFDPSSLKVNDLRDELRRRGLNPLGLKAVLLKRLSEALAKEDKTLEDFAKSLSEAKSPIKKAAAVEADSGGSTEENLLVSANGDSSKNEKCGEDKLSSSGEKISVILKDESNTSNFTQQPDSSGDFSVETANDQEKPDSTEQTYNSGDTHSVEKDTEESDSVLKSDLDSKSAQSVEQQAKSEDETSHKEPSNQSESVISKTKSEHSSRESHGQSKDKDRSRERDRSGERRRHSRDRNHSRERDRSRGRDRSSDRDRRRSPRRTRERSISIEDELDGWETKEDVFLDLYNSDLSLVISHDLFSGKPLTEEGFCLMWAGARANYGVRSGKTFFEVKLVRELPVDDSDSDMGGATHVLRIGWSVDKAGLALGEEANTFGYGGTGKKSTDGKFEDYGIEFKEGDVVGAFLEVTNSEAVMSFSVNGSDQGECYRVSKSSFGDVFALFPHIYVKNVEFSVNFGQNGQAPWFPPPDTDLWTLIGLAPLEDRVRGLLPPASKGDCEVIMMIGLPGSGKTYFAANLCKDKPEKYYNVLGTNLILDKMRVMGLSRKRNYAGRWDVLINKATQCLNKIISVACKRRRNYILDQTNVYPSAQRRKMRPFDGFQRKAIVIVPTDEEFKRRIDQRTKEEGKEVPEKAVLEMKANFEVPKAVSDDSGSMFDEVIFAELQREAAEKLVKEYNLEGKASRAAERRSRADSPGHRDHSRSHRDDRHRDSRSRYDSYSRSSGRADHDRRESRGSRFDHRSDRGPGEDRGRFGSRYREEGRGGRDNGRYDRFDNEPDYRNRGPGGSFGGAFQRNSRGSGGAFGGSPFPRPPYPGPSPFGVPYGPNEFSFNRGGFNRGGGEPRRAYSRGGRGGGGGFDNYGGTPGYGYYQPGERRRYDDTDSVDPSSGPPPSKQPALGDGQYRGGYQGDSYRGNFRGGRGGGGGGDRGPSFGGGNFSQPPGSSYPGAYYGTYGQQQQTPQSKSGDSATSSGYPGTASSRADDFQKSQSRGGAGPYSVGSGSRPSRFSSASTDDKPKPDSPGSRFRSSYQTPQGYAGGKDSQGQSPRLRFDQPGGSLAQQGQDPYGLGGAYGQQTGGRQTSTGGSSQGYGYGYGPQGRNAPGGGVSSSTSKPPQGYGSEFGNRGSNAQQQQKPSQQGGFGGGFGGAFGRQPPQSAETSQQRFSKSFGGADQSSGVGFNKPTEQQQSYASDAYSHRISALSNPSAPKFQQQGYGSEFHGGEMATKSGQEPQGGYYQGYGSASSTGSSSGKPGQQQGYGGGAYNQQSGAPSQGQSGYYDYGQQSGASMGAQQYQQRYSGDSGSVSASSRSAYGQQSTAQSKLDPRSYDYSLYGAAAYGFGSDKAPATGAQSGSTKPGGVAAGAGGTSLYAAALDAASKGNAGDSGRVGAEPTSYGSTTASTSGQQQMPNSAYGYGAASGYYGGAAAPASGSWPFGVNPTGGSGETGGSQAQQGSGYSYGQR